jgi:hypothetical protein
MSEDISKSIDLDWNQSCVVNYKIILLNFSYLNKSLIIRTDSIFHYLYGQILELKSGESLSGLTSFDGVSIATTGNKIEWTREVTMIGRI